jgi:hypothetical protein
MRFQFVTLVALLAGSSVFAAPVQSKGGAQPGQVVEPSSLWPKDKPVTIGDLAKLPERVQHAIKLVQEGEITDLSGILHILSIWNYEDHHGSLEVPKP